MTRDEMVSKIAEAEDILLEVYWDARDERGNRQIINRLETITAKVNELKYRVLEGK